MVAYAVGCVAAGARQEAVVARKLSLRRRRYPMDFRTGPWWRRLGQAACQGSCAVQTREGRREKDK